MRSVYCTVVIDCVLNRRKIRRKISKMTESLTHTKTNRNYEINKGMNSEKEL